MPFVSPEVSTVLISVFGVLSDLGFRSSGFITLLSPHGPMVMATRKGAAWVIAETTAVGQVCGVQWRGEVCYSVGFWFGGFPTPDFRVPVRERHRAALEMSIRGGVEPGVVDHLIFRVERSWSQTMSRLLGDGVSTQTATCFLIGGAVRGSTHFRISECPSANERPPARLW
jgi:hypothetical protein